MLLCISNKFTIIKRYVNIAVTQLSLANVKCGLPIGPKAHLFD